MQIEGFIPIIIKLPLINNLPLLLGFGGDGGESDIGFNPDYPVKEPEKINLLN